MTFANDCRNVFATPEEAQAQLDAAFGPGNPNSADTIRQLFGDNPRFAVRQALCYPNGYVVSLCKESEDQVADDPGS